MGVAKIKYDEAEEAYTSNNFSQCLQKLDEVVEILKATNPRVQYLRINCLAKMVEKDPLSNMAQLIQFNKFCQDYLNDYDNIPDLEDKYKTVYYLYSSLKKYPKNEKEYQDVISLRKRGRIYKYDKDSIDLEKAKSLFEQAMNKGDFRSKVELADMYEKGGVDFIPDPNKANVLYLELASSDIPEGKFYLGKKYIQEKNWQQGYDLILEAANKRYLPAITLYGIIEFSSYQIERTKSDSATLLPNRAFRVKKWFSQAESVGESSSEFYYYLGKAYALGIITGTADFTKGVEYFTKSANLGNVKGLNALGYCYMNGLGGLALDVNKAFELFKPCAEKYFAASEYNLSVLYNGYKGFEKDKNKNKYWLDRYYVNKQKCIEEIIPNTTREIY